MKTVSFLLIWHNLPLIKRKNQLFEVMLNVCPVKYRKPDDVQVLILWSCCCICQTKSPKCLNCQNLQATQSQKFVFSVLHKFQFDSSSLVPFYFTFILSLPWNNSQVSVWTLKRVCHSFRSYWPWKDSFLNSFQWKRWMTESTVLPLCKWKFRSHDEAPAVWLRQLRWLSLEHKISSLFPRSAEAEGQTKRGTFYAGTKPLDLSQTAEASY